MGWVTLDDGQHVFIGQGGKVLATRSAISRGAPAKSRGKAKQQPVAGEIKTAQVVGQARTARAGKAGIIDAQNRMKAGHERMAKAKAILGNKINDTAYLKSMARDEVMNRTPGTKQWAAKEYLAGRGTVQDASYDLPREQIIANAQQSATTRAIEHARAAGPTLREQADKARAAKGTREQRLFDIAGKSNAAQYKLGNEITKNRPRSGYKASENKRLAKVQEPLKAREAIVSERHGKIVAAQMKATESSTTTRAIEHARAAGPTLREQADKAISRTYSRAARRLNLR